MFELRLCEAKHYGLTMAAILGQYFSRSCCSDIMRKWKSSWTHCHSTIDSGNRSAAQTLLTKEIVISDSSGSFIFLYLLKYAQSLACTLRWKWDRSGGARVPWPRPAFAGRNFVPGLPSYKAFLKSGNLLYRTAVYIFNCPTSEAKGGRGT